MSTMIDLFSEVAELWKADKRRYVKKSSYAIYLIHLNKHLLPFFGSGGAPSEGDIQAFVDQQIEAGMAISTIQSSLLVLNMILNYGEKAGRWPHILYSVHYPTSSKRRRKIEVLTKEQQKKLSNHLDSNFSFRNLGIMICLMSGLRIGEICALQWKDLDVDGGVIHVNKTLQRIYLSDGGEREYILQVNTPKTVSSVRDIPMSRKLSRVVKPLRKVMNPDHYVITNTAEPLEPRYYRDYFTRLMTGLGLPPVRFHALRHSFATRCIESRCDYKTVSTILGHASLATTMDLYVHPGYDDKKRVIEKMSRAID